MHVDYKGKNDIRFVFFPPLAQALFDNLLTSINAHRLDFSMESGRNAILVHSLNRHQHPNANNECFDFKYVFIVSVCNVNGLFLLPLLRTEHKRALKKTCWPNFQLKDVNSFSLPNGQTVRIILRIKRPENVSFQRHAVWEQMQQKFKNKPRKFVTHFHTEVFCITVRDLCTVRVAFNLKLRQRRCNGMNQKMQKCRLPNRYIRSVTLDRKVFLGCWIFSHLILFFFRYVESEIVLQHTRNHRD